MSFLLDALKKSEGDQPQSPVDLFAESYKVDLEPESHIPQRSWLVASLVLIIVVLVAGLSFMLGQTYSQSHAQESLVQHASPINKSEPEHSVQHTNARSQPALSNVVNSDKPDAAERPNATQAKVNHDSFTAAFNEPNDLAANSTNTASESVNATVPVVSQTRKIQNTDDSDETVGKRLTNNASEFGETEEVSNSLLLRFEKAVAETMALSDQEIYETQRADIVTPLVDMPASIQKAVPALAFQTHIYSSNVEERWIKVNGVVVRELDNIAPNLTLVEIMPQNVVLKLGDDEFSLPALSDW